jgi:hypothetical protein
MGLPLLGIWLVFIWMKGHAVFKIPTINRLYLSCLSVTITSRLLAELILIESLVFFDTIASIDL